MESYCQNLEYSMKHNLMKLFLKISLLLMSALYINISSASDGNASPTSTDNLTPFKAKYIAYRNGNDLGHALMQLEKMDNGYKLYYESDVSIFFLSDRRTEPSFFDMTNGQFQQKEYQYTREGTGRDKALNLKFDAASNQITKDDKGVINWQGEWDNQLYRFDLQQKLKNKESHISYNLINYRGQLKTYGFEIIGEEVLDLPFGKLNTIKVKTIRESKRRETFSWFAPDLNYQLVRLQQFKEGDEQGDIHLSEYSVEE